MLMPLDSSSSSDGWRLLGQVLKPSALSGVISIAGGIAFIAILAINTQLKGTLLPTVIYDWSNSAAFWQTGDVSYAHIWADFSATTVAFVAWALFGLVCILALAGLYKPMREIADLKQDLAVLHGSRRKIIIGEIERIGFRLLAVALWVGYFWLFFNGILKYSISAAIAGSSLTSLEDLGYLLLACAITIVGLHIHFIFARLVVLRPRVFGNV